MNHVAVHPLEDRASEAAYFARQNPNGAAAYRRAVKATTGSLPTWAQPQKRGRNPRQPAAVPITSCLMPQGMPDGSTSSHGISLDHRSTP